MSTLPFVIRGVITSLVDLNGIARLEENHLCLEFTTVHPLSKFIRSEAREVRIPLAELEEGKFRSIFCFGFLHLRARNMSAFSSVPGATGCQLRLRCKREHFALAREFVSRINMRTVTQELKDLIAETNTQTPAMRLPPSESEAKTQQVRRATPIAGQQ